MLLFFNEVADWILIYNILQYYRKIIKKTLAKIQKSYIFVRSNFNFYNMENPGEHIVGQYLQLVKGCDFVQYNLQTKKLKEK